MRSQTEEPEQSSIKSRVLGRVKRMSRVPLMSDSTTRLLEISRMSADDVNISELDKLIQRDPSLATRILRVANSPYYAMRSTINTVRQSILVIGLSDLFSLLLVTSLMDKFEGEAGLRNLDPNEFWLHSVAVGSAARGAQPFVSASMLSPAEINLAGLLHDIGRNVFIRHFPKEFDRCVDQVKRHNRFLQDAEEEILGIDHAEVGGILAQGWNLPEFIQQVIRFHHKPEEADDLYQDAAHLVAWADSLAIEENIGDSGNMAPLPPEEGQVRVYDICQKKRKEILKSVRQHFDSLQIEMPEALEVEVSEVIDVKKPAEEEVTQEVLVPAPQLSPPAEQPAPSFLAASEPPKTIFQRFLGWFK